MPKIQKFTHFSIVSFSPRTQSGQVPNGYGRARGVWAARRRRRSNDAIWPRIPVPRIAYWGRDGKKLLTESPQNELSYIFMCVDA